MAKSKLHSKEAKAKAKATRARTKTERAERFNPDTDAGRLYSILYQRLDSIIKKHIYQLGEDYFNCSTSQGSIPAGLSKLIHKDDIQPFADYISTLFIKEIKEQNKKMKPKKNKPQQNNLFEFIHNKS